MSQPDALDALLAGSSPRPSLAGSANADRRASAGGAPTLPVKPRPAKPRPDPRPMRLAIAVTGIAAASAIATAIVTPPGAAGTNGAAEAVTVATVVQQPLPAPSHITRYVRLAPGQTAPPQASVQQLPAPAPRVVVVTTRVSGKP